MTRLFVLSILLYLSLQSFTQDYIIPTPSKSNSQGIQKSSPMGAQMHFSLNAIYGKDTKNNKGEYFTELYFGKGYSKGEIGSPNLPAFKKLIQIPYGADVEIKVLGYSQSDLTLSDYGVKNLVYPNQPSPSKSDDLEKLPFHFDSKSYSRKSFQETPIATIEVLGTLRGVRIARIEVSPVDYNPTTGVIRVYNDIDVEIRLNGLDDSKNSDIQRKTYSPYFESLYKTLENPMSKGVFDDHPDLMKYPVKMVIVSDRMFEETLQPFIQWKTKKGFTVDVGYTDDIGDTVQDIKDYVHGKYNNATEQNPAPSFLVLVGDIQQVKASATGSASQKSTDLYYASVDGDHFPEMYYGRLSAQTTTQLNNIINKIIYYEQYQFSNPEYLDNATLIAGVDSNWNPKVGQPTVKYGTKYYFNDENGYNTVWGYGVASDPNNPNNSTGYSGCYDNERISVGFINYTAHCNEGSWGDPFLGISSVNSMANTGMYPLAIGNCCLSADFGTTESIGESWIRAENRGAVTYIGSSPNSFWYEDFYWSVGAFPLVGGNSDGRVPTYDETTLGVFDAPKHSNYLTTSGLVFVGNLAVTEANLQGYPSGSSTVYYWQAYNVLGDPSLMPYFTQGSSNNVLHNSVLPIGLNEFKVMALPGSYVALSKEGILIGTAFVDQSGEANVLVTPVITEGEVDIVVTRPQTIPYIESVPAVAIDGSYIVLQGYQINDVAGNSNGFADYGESFSLNTTLKNIGTEDGMNISASLSGIDDYFTIIEGESVGFGNIPSDQTATLNSCFSFQLSDNVPNKYEATFVLTITDGTDTWLSNLKLKALAPELKIENHTIEEEGSGALGILDPGETANIKITIFNKGNSNTVPAQATLSTSSEYLTINGSNTIEVPAIEALKEINILFSVMADELTPPETPTILNLAVQAGNYSSEKNLEVIVGYIPDYIIGSSAVVTSCKGRFYDSGAATANYSNNEDIIITFFPKNEFSYLKFEFTEFNTEEGYDKLYIYNGTDTSAPLISGNAFSGANSPGTIYATNAQGALTFRFTSDALVTSSGWKANFECYEILTAPECVQLIAPQDLSIIENSPLQLKWEMVSGAFSYDIYLGKDNLPQEPTFTTVYDSYNYQLNNYTNYVWKVVPKNSFGSAAECPTWTFSTFEVSSQFNIHTGTVSICNGDFYDSGGASANYSSNENYTLTITPADPGKVVRVSFSRFATESNYDFLRVYDGLTTSSELLVQLSGATLPNDIIATSASGALTFHFTSDHNVQGEGWEARVTCETPTTAPIFGAGIAVYPNPFNESIRVIGLNNTTKVEIANTLGGIVYTSIHHGEEELNIPTSNLPKGLYIVTFINKAGERIVRRLVKQ